MEEKSSRICCVTGASGYVGSCLVRKFLEKGHVVHAILRNLGDPMKVGLLKNLPGADARLKLFQADLYDYDDGSLASAIGGCEFVFHVATPLVHNHLSSKYKDTTEAAVGAATCLLELCIASGTVKRLIYTGSVLSCSALYEDGCGFKDFMDETCWTPLTPSLSEVVINQWKTILNNGSQRYLQDYITSKTVTEKELLKHNDREEEQKGGVEVVSLTCGLVGGDSHLSYLAESARVIISPLLGENNIPYVQLIKAMQAILGSVPLIHIKDVCEAHVFCLEQASIAGRFLCASVYPTLSEIINFYQKNYAHLLVVDSTMEDEDLKRKVTCKSTELVDMGFKFEHDMEKIIHDNVEYAKRLGTIL